MIKAAAAALLACSHVDASNVYQFQSNLGLESPDSFSVSGRGSHAIAMRNYALNYNHEVTIHTTTLGSGGIEISVPQAEIFPKTEFGVMDLVGDHVTGQMLFVTDINRLNSAVNLYKAKWFGDTWSQVGTIIAPDNSTVELTDPAYYFGRRFSIDHKSLRSLAVGYGDATPFLTYPVGYGKICMYEPTSPSADEWLSTQVLEVPDAVSTKTIRLSGTFINMNDDTIVADAYHVVSDVYSLEIFSRGRNGMWSHQQSYTPSSDLILATVYDHTIAYSVNDLSATGTDLIGKSAVYIMHPNTPDYDTSRTTSSRRLGGDNDHGHTDEEHDHSEEHSDHSEEHSGELAEHSEELADHSEEEHSEEHSEELADHDEKVATNHDDQEESHADQEENRKGPGKSSPSEESKNSPDTKPKPKPKAVALKWSVVQTLTSPNRNSNSDVGFGSDLSLNGNTLTVGEVGDGGNTGFLYVFTRASRIGMFSLQQTIVPSIPTNSYLSLHAFSNGLLLASSIHDIGGASNDIWLGENLAWGCVKVQLEDLYGDGWDGATLRIHTPFDDVDVFAPLCRANPLVFRYCPSELSQEGLYSFSIAGAEKAKYKWEIRWLVTEERSGVTHRGDSTTSMDFIFKNGQFSAGKTDHVLPTNATCQNCGGYPVPKPKPRPRTPTPESKPAPAEMNDKSKEKPSPARRLHPGHSTDHTVSPTISPAPTLSVTAGASDWDVITMTTSGGDWFRDEYIGTHFYISDLSGQHLITTGTLCGDILTGSCMHSLSNGQYTLRVSGDLNGNSADHSWSFCGRVGGASDSLVFQIYNGACTPLMRLTKEDACLVINPLTGVQLYSIAEGSLLMVGIGLTGMTSVDKTLFADAIVHTIPGSLGATVTGVTKNAAGTGVLISFSVKLKIQDLGYDPLDFESLSAMYSMEESKLNSNTLTQKMIAELSQAGYGVSSYFTGLQSVQLVSFAMSSDEFVKSELVTNTEEEDTDSAEISKISKSEDKSSAADAEDNAAVSNKDLYFDLGVAGYALTAAAVAGIVVLAVRWKKHVALKQEQEVFV